MADSQDCFQHKRLKPVYQNRYHILRIIPGNTPTPCLIHDLLLKITKQARDMIRFADAVNCPGVDEIMWIRNFPMLLYEFQSRLEGVDGRCLSTVPYGHLWGQLIEDDRVKSSLEKLKTMLADYFPVFDGDSMGALNNIIEDVKTVIDVMLVMCYELCDPEKELGIFNFDSNSLLGRRTFAEKQLEILSKVEKSLSESSCSKAVGKELVVGFDEESTMLLERLTITTQKKLQLISIVGMPGLGKTTLARKVYTDPLIIYSFDIRAWTSVSQGYVKRVVLLGILSSFIDRNTEIHSLSDEHLGEKLYRSLKGMKYLVVFDDMWDGQAWDDLKIYFPDDHNGSRIMFTGRDTEFHSDLLAASPPFTLHLDLRTEEQSWDIFQKMVFPKGICFWMLKRVGREITRKCQGLPLAIAITAGLLRNKWTRASWQQVANSLSTYIVSDPNQYMDTLALSYNYLPAHLRPCFLYLSAFPEDCEISVVKLIWLWVAKGFIYHMSDGKSLEETAEDYLMELIKRSLVMVARRRSDGGVKTCRIHDLLRNFCLRKAEEENFSQTAYRYGQANTECYASSSSLVDIADHLLGTSSMPFPQPELSPWCFPDQLGKSLHEGRSISNESYEWLSILDVESIGLVLFPNEVINLINLRYLAIQAKDGSPPAAISNLVNLQTLVISSRRNIVIPRTTWNMINLRHLYVRSGENLLEETCIEDVSGKEDHCSTLESIQTISRVSPSSPCKNILSRTPNLKKLGFCGSLMSRLGDLEFPTLCSLEGLQILKLFNTTAYPESGRLCDPIKFPERLKKLTLSNTGMAWEEMWKFSLVPNLEVLKLKFHACIGDKWQISRDVEFRKLKFLKLQGLDVREWETLSHSFPCLQRLVMQNCPNLRRIPRSLGEILTLDLIVVSCCSESATESAREIQHEQESMGNENLKVLMSVPRRNG